MRGSASLPSRNGSTRQPERGAKEAVRAQPPSAGGIDRLGAAAPPQPPCVTGADGALERLADEIVQTVERIRGHGALMPRRRGEVHPVGEEYCEYVSLPLMSEPP